MQIFRKIGRDGNGSTSRRNADAGNEISTEQGKRLDSPIRTTAGDGHQPPRVDGDIFQRAFSPNHSSADIVWHNAILSDTISNGNGNGRISTSNGTSNGTSGRQSRPPCIC